MQDVKPIGTPIARVDSRENACQGAAAMPISGRRTPQDAPQTADAQRVQGEGVAPRGDGEVCAVVSELAREVVTYRRLLGDSNITVAEVIGEARYHASARTK